jgi:inosine-uridine nucleoside N-ribohydrolase
MRKPRLLSGLLLLACAFAACDLSAQTAKPTAKPTAPAAPAKQLVLLDTDIGDDIDDAFALSLILKSPEFKLLGVTTAYGKTELRARLVERFLAATGHKDIPVYPGVVTHAANPMTQAAYAERQPKRKYSDGIDFMLRQIRLHPGQVTLIAIGPLFNVETALSVDPVTFKKLKRIVLMGGSIDRGYDGPGGALHPPDAEWNINRYPKGLRAILASGVSITMLPLDSTQVHLAVKERESIFANGSPLTDQLTLLYHQWRNNNADLPDTPTLYDPVAVTYAFKPELCPATPMHIEVDEKGFTHKTDGPPNASVCLKLDEAGFIQLLLDRIVEKPATKDDPDEPSEPEHLGVTTRNGN